MDLCKLTAIGHVQPRDPELKFTGDGRPLLTFRMVCNYKRKKDGELIDEPVWLSITVWGQNAERMSNMLSKGSHVYVEGRLSAPEWTDKDGKNRTSLSVFANDVILLGGRGESTGSGPQGATVDDDSSLPF